jgi:hypothetical protein
MDKIGRVQIDPGSSDSRLDGVLLAVQGDGDPFGAATGVIQNSGLTSGDCASVSPATSGRVGGVPVLFITSAQSAPNIKCGPALTGAGTEAFAFTAKKAAAKKTRVTRTKTSPKKQPAKHK